MIATKVKKAIAAGVIVGLLASIITMFYWKMLYYPEPISHVFFEVMGFTAASVVAIWCVLNSGGGYHGGNITK